MNGAAGSSERAKIGEVECSLITITKRVLVIGHQQLRTESIEFQDLSKVLYKFEEAVFMIFAFLNIHGANYRSLKVIMILYSLSTFLLFASHRLTHYSLPKPMKNDPSGRLCTYTSMRSFLPTYVTAGVGMAYCT